MFRRQLSFALCFLLSFTAASEASSPVWKVSKGDSHIYLAGTIHLLAQEDHPLPKSFDKAYSAAQSIVFETDLAAMESPEFLLKMNQIITFNDGRTLQTSIKPDTYKTLSDYFKNRGMNVGSFVGLTPTGVMLTVSMMEMQLMGMNPSLGVEAQYLLQAKRDNKPLLHLESPQEQLNFIASLGAEDADQLILQTLTDLKSLPSIMKQMKAAWRVGDNAKLNSLALSEMKKFPAAYQSLLVDRNNNWLPKIEKMLQDKKVEFVLVGALHLVGEDGVLSLLKERGYKIENL